MGEFLLYSFLVSTALMLAPIFLYVDAYADLRGNRAWFCISLFHRLKLFGGYAEVRKEGFVFHLTKKKAILLPFTEMANARKRFEVTKGFQLWKFHQIVETDGANAPKGVMIAAFLRLVTSTAFCVLRERHPFVSLKHRVLLHDCPCLKVTVRAACVLNGLVLVLAFVKIVLEGLLKWMRNRKSTLSWRKLRKNLRGSST